MRFQQQDEKQFNSSISYLDRIETRWEDCDQAKIAGNVLTYFRSLEVIYRNTHPFFNKEEQKEAEALIKKCENNLKQMNSQKSAMMQMALTGAENTCDQLRMKLVALLFKYKITYYQTEHKDLETEIDEDFP